MSIAIGGFICSKRLIAALQTGIDWIISLRFQQAAENYGVHQSVSLALVQDNRISSVLQQDNWQDIWMACANFDV